MAAVGGIGGSAFASMIGRERCGREREMQERDTLTWGSRERNRFYYVVGPWEKVKHMLSTRVKKQI